MIIIVSQVNQAVAACYASYICRMSVLHVVCYSLVMCVLL